MRFTQLDDWLAWQESLHSSEIDMGLERITRVARAMNLLQPNCQVITVAGTNGKGSCVAVLEALCRASHMKVGAFTSPHFLRYNERIRVDGQPVSDQLICSAFARIDDARGDVSLTYFEFGALAAMDILQRENVDVMVLEVGLGGRLDAVNILDADIAVLTSVAIDHERFLGTDRESIGREKAGVFRANNPAICADRTPPASIGAVANETSTHLIQVGKDFDFGITTDANDERLFWWQGIDGQNTAVTFNSLPQPRLPLPSTAAALQAFLLLGHGFPDELSDTLVSISLTGRAQEVSHKGRSFVLDVAHNPAAAKHLNQKLQCESCQGKTFAIIGVMEDKDRLALLTELLPSIDHWLTVSLPEVPRAATADQLCDDLKRLKTEATALTCVDQAIKLALQESTSIDRIVILGSFFTVAQALPVLTAET